MNTKTIGVVLVLGLAVGLWTYGNANNDAGEITACANRSGLIRLIGDGFRRDECRRNETAVSWNTEGEKGETGEDGEQGEKGDTGEAGADGEGGTEFHLVDGDGQDLGIVLRARTNANGFTTYIAEVDGLFGFDQTANEAGLLKNGVGVHFEQAECAGEPHFKGNFSKSTQVIYHDRVEDKFYKKNADDNVQERDSQSRLEVDRGCVGDLSTDSHTLLLEEITLPFTEPLAVPLEVKTL